MLREAAGEGDQELDEEEAPSSTEDVPPEEDVDTEPTESLPPTGVGQELSALPEYGIGGDEEDD